MFNNFLTNFCRMKGNSTAAEAQQQARRAADSSTTSTSAEAQQQARGFATDDGPRLVKKSNAKPWPSGGWPLWMKDCLEYSMWLEQRRRFINFNRTLRIPQDLIPHGAPSAANSGGNNNEGSNRQSQMPSSGPLPPNSGEINTANSGDQNETPPGASSAPASGDKKDGGSGQEQK